MKRVLFVLLDLLSGVFLAGGYVIQYFTKRKLGMVRWINYYNLKFQKQLPLDTLKYVAAIAALLLTVLVLVFYVKKRKNLGKPDLVMVIWQMVLAAAYLGVTAIASVEVMRAYYFVLPLMGMAVLMQVLRNLIAIGTCQNEK